MPDRSRTLLLPVCLIRRGSWKAVITSYSIHYTKLYEQYLDNGRGFDMEKLSSEEAVGMGIPNIETRVRSVDGVFVIESAKGKGTSALIRVDK